MVVVVGTGSGPVNDITNVSSAVPVLVVPTAAHSVTLTHDTDHSRPLLVPALRVDKIDHVEPSHTITNASKTEPFESRPTATHEDAFTQDTEIRKLFPVPTLGLGAIDQDEPSHAITNVS